MGTNSGGLCVSRNMSFNKLICVVELASIGKNERRVSPENKVKVNIYPVNYYLIIAKRERDSD